MGLVEPLKRPEGKPLEFKRDDAGAQRIREEPKLALRCHT
jgi:hypothetical protein